MTTKQERQRILDNYKKRLQSELVERMRKIGKSKSAKKQQAARDNLKRARLLRINKKYPGLKLKVQVEDPISRGYRQARRVYSKLKPCAVCGSKKSERHHKDGNPENNCAENIEFLCHPHHAALHKEERTHGRMIGI